jgi:predicted PurR-regulated permease PerM
MAGRDALVSTRGILLALFMVGLLLFSYLILRWFIAPVVWALILAYVSWPLYERLRENLHGNAIGSALLMTALLTTAFVLPMLWLVALVQTEVVIAYEAVSAYLETGMPGLPELLGKVPWIGQRLQQWFDSIVGDPTQLREEALRWTQGGLGKATDLLGGVGRNAAKLGFALLTVVFIYRDGEKLLDQVRRLLLRYLGRRTEGYLRAMGATTKAVLYGLILTALAQGALAGLGYWVAGIHAPALFGALTALVALIPFGTPFVWGSLGIWLLVSGETLAGIGLLLWGALVVSWVDNLIRPLVISSASQIPFLLVMFGVLGGIGTFGLVGMFVGPVIMAVLMAVWREWLEDAPPAPGA